MPVESLGYRTDLFFIRELGQIEERERYLVARTPSNPTFFWGNFLLFPEPPGTGSAGPWRDDFAREFPDAAHVAFGWDATLRGEPQAFLDAGFVLQELVVLQAPSVQAPPRLSAECIVRPLLTAQEWTAARELAVRSRGPEFPDEDAYRIFQTGRTRNFRRLQERGAGFTYGAFLGDVLAGVLGIFGNAGIARYQQVEVDQPYRRRGICGTMMWRAAEHFASTRAVEEFVIVTETDNVNRTTVLYESVGFGVVQAQWGLCKRA